MSATEIPLHRRLGLKGDEAARRAATLRRAPTRTRLRRCSGTGGEPRSDKPINSGVKRIA